jgi:sulfur-oxidizing protein SoxY
VDAGGAGEVRDMDCCAAAIRHHVLFVLFFSPHSFQGIIAMNNLRRTLLKGAGSGAALVAALAAGLLRPVQAMAAEWNRAAFEAKDMAGALKGIGAASLAESGDLILKVPEIAENGAVVPIDVVSNIPDISEISIIIEKNPFPLSAHFRFANGAQGDVSVRLKFAQTSMVKVIAKAGDKFYTVQKEVKVTVGGCGG